MTNTEWMRQRLLDAAGVDDRPVGHRTLAEDQVFATQWSEEFVTLMRNRLAMGYFRYAPLGTQKGTYDNVGSCIKRLGLYRRPTDGNLEHLVDVANICLVEFVTGNHPNRHFEAADDGVHTQLA